MGAQVTGLEQQHSSFSQTTQLNKLDFQNTLKVGGVREITSKH